MTHGMKPRKNTFLKSPKYSVCRILGFIKEFFSVSTIQGLTYIIRDNLHPIERTIWFLVVTAAIYVAAILSGQTLARYQENPTVISMERDRFSWNTSFPSATICPTAKTDLHKLDAFLDSAIDIKNKSKYRQFIISLIDATYSNLERIVDYEGIPGEAFLDLIRKFQINFEPTVTNSASNQIQSYLQQTYTEMGLCFSFNSHLAVYSSFEYLDRGTWKLLPENETFFVNPLDGEVFANIVNISSDYKVMKYWSHIWSSVPKHTLRLLDYVQRRAVRIVGDPALTNSLTCLEHSRKIYIHGPYEVPDIASKHLFSPNGYFIQLFLTGMTIFSSESTKELRVQQRKCRFHHESNLKHSPVYSYVLCRMECRVSLAKKMCGCTPHFYRKIDGEKICNVSGLRCLAKYKERLIILKNECSCLANCDEVNFIVEDIDRREWFLGSNLQWGLHEYPKMRLRRDVIFSFTDLLVYIGGMAGLFLGCSVLSFIEIIYFFTLRLFWFLMNYRRDAN